VNVLAAYGSLCGRDRQTTENSSPPATTSLTSSGVIPERSRTHAAYPQIVEIDAKPEAIEHITASGGRLFIWRDDAGLIHADTKRPGLPVAFRSVPRGDFELLQDERIPEPLLWRVVVEGFSHPRIHVYWNSRIPGGIVGSGYRFWRALLRR
jgi:hypothetical protein